MSKSSNQNILWTNLCNMMHIVYRKNVFENHDIFLSSHQPSLGSSYPMHHHSCEIGVNYLALMSRSEDICSITAVSVYKQLSTQSSPSSHLCRSMDSWIHGPIQRCNKMADWVLSFLHICTGWIREKQYDIMRQSWKRVKEWTTVLTLNVPCPPDGIVEANLVPPKKFQAFEVFPFWRHQSPTDGDKTTTCSTTL